MLCAPSIHCCICCLVRARLYQSIDRLVWSSLISSSRMVRSRRRWLALSLKNPMCGETTGGKGFHLQVCVPQWHSVRLAPCCLCVCDVCVLVSLHLAMFASVHFVNVVQGCAGKQSTINEMLEMRMFLQFPSQMQGLIGPDCMTTLRQHFSAPRYQGLIRVSLPSCLPVWFEGFKSLAAQSYIVLHSPTMFAESILMIPFRTLSIMNLGSNKQISVLICMSFKHLHLYLEDIWAVCGTWRKWMNRVV